MKENLLHAELSGGTHAYSAGGKHRHLGEFDQEFSRVAGRSVQVQFTPHLLPMNRGILATVYVRGDAKTVHQVLETAYETELFLKVLASRKLGLAQHLPPHPERMAILEALIRDKLSDPTEASLGAREDAILSSLKNHLSA